MFGREPRLPVDIAFNVDNNNTMKSKTKYIDDMRARLEKSYKLAVTSSKKAKERQKLYYDLKTRGAIIQPGDRVLVKIMAYEGKHKIADKWEDEPYIVQSRPNLEIPVYVLKKENGEGKTRTLHRNLLLPIGHLDCFTPPEEQQKQTTSEEQQKEKQGEPSDQRRVKPTRVTRTSNSLPKAVDADSDSDDTDTSSIERTVEIVETRNPPATVTVEQNDTAAASDGVNSAGDDQSSVTPMQEAEVGGDAHSLDTGSASASVHAEQDEGGGDIEGKEDQEHHDDHQDDTTDVDQEAERQHDQTDHEGSQRERPDHSDDRDTRDVDGIGGDDDRDEEQLRTRKSKRPSKRPKWMQTGEFVMQQQTISNSDWKARADYLAGLARSVILDRMDSSVSSALISIVMGIQE